MTFSCPVLQSRDSQYNIRDIAPVTTINTINRAFNQNSLSLPAISSYINTLCSAKEWETAVQMLMYLDGIPTEHEHSFLVHYLTVYGLPLVIGPAMRKCGQPVFFLEAMSEVLEVTSRKGDDIAIISKLCLMAEFRHEWYDQDDEPMQLIEDALERLKSTDAVTQCRISGWIIYYTNKLAQLYFDCAVICHRSMYTIPSLNHQTTKVTFFSRWTRLGQAS